MKRALLLLPLLLAACWPFGQRRNAFDPDALTLCVENATLGYGNVIARAELVRFDVLPGETVCKRIAIAGPGPAITARTTGGGAAGPLTFAARLPSGGPGCWYWRLGSTQASQIDLQPCDEEPSRIRAVEDTLPMPDVG